MVKPLGEKRDQLVYVDIGEILDYETNWEGCVCVCVCMSDGVECVSVEKTIKPAVFSLSAQIITIIVDQPLQPATQ